MVPSDPLAIGHHRPFSLRYDVSRGIYEIHSVPLHVSRECVVTSRRVQLPERMMRVNSQGTYERIAQSTLFLSIKCCFLLLSNSFPFTG